MLTARNEAKGWKVPLGGPAAGEPPKGSPKRGPLSITKPPGGGTASHCPQLAASLHVLTQKTLP